MINETCMCNQTLTQIFVERLAEGVVKLAFTYHILIILFATVGVFSLLVGAYQYSHKMFDALKVIIKWLFRLIYCVVLWLKGER